MSDPDTVVVPQLHPTRIATDVDHLRTLVTGGDEASLALVPLSQTLSGIGVVLPGCRAAIVTLDLHHELLMRSTGDDLVDIVRTLISDPEAVVQVWWITTESRRLSFVAEGPHVINCVDADGYAVGSSL